MYVYTFYNSQRPSFNSKIKNLALNLFAVYCGFFWLPVLGFLLIFIFLFFYFVIGFLWRPCCIALPSWTRANKARTARGPCRRCQPEMPNWA